MKKTSFFKEKNIRNICLARIAVICSGMAMVLMSCQSNKVPEADKLPVEWEVISSIYGSNPAVKAVFKISNNSSITLGDDNWSFYFNQSPRDLLSYDTLSGLRIERLSGDFYKISPLPGFSLAPGQHISLWYESSHWWIKDTDAPKGCYWVFLDNSGEQHIAVASAFRNLPLNRPEQVQRHLADQEAEYTPERSYQENQNMYPLPVRQIRKIIPAPLSFVENENIVDFSFPLTVQYQKDLISEANYLKNQIEAIFDKEVLLKEGESNQANSLILKTGLKKRGLESNEAYRLSVQADKTIIIEGTASGGVFYGIQSFIALLPLEPVLSKAGSFTLNELVIEDAPRFAYRGVHVDVARNFQEKGQIFKILDILAFYKINTLHFHLTDDEGWRLEIPALPELTSIASSRGHTGVNENMLHPSYGSGPFNDSEGNHGNGYYSVNDFVEILSYANQRHIKVVPEINMPGHSRAAIKAMEARYEHFMKQGMAEEAEKYRLIDPEDKSVYKSAQYFSDNVVCVARESTYTFFETVLDAVLQMYDKAGLKPEIFNVGGDEVAHGAWTQSPMIEKLKQSIDDPLLRENMHAYYLKRVIEILRRKGLKMGGWEEIGLVRSPEGLLIPNKMLAGPDVIPYVWNNLWGMQDLAYRLANAGYPVVLCHVTNFYFDLAYNKAPYEPGLYWGGFVDTKSAWHYNPYDVFKSTIKDNMGRLVDIEVEYAKMERLNKNSRDKILGIQAQLWSETILGPEMLEYSLLPKLAGLAESAWAKERIWETTMDKQLREKQIAEDWNAFANALAVRELPRLSLLFGGYNYRIPPPGAILKNNKLFANTEYPGLIIRYTTDGTEPNEKSPVYSEAVDVIVNQVTLKSFDLSGRGSRTITVSNKNN